MRAEENLAKTEEVIGNIKIIKGFEKVKFVILYGSAAEGRAIKSSDVDICIYYEGDSEEASDFRFKVLSELFDDMYDVQIYQQLPVYIRIEVLKGKVIYCADKHFLHETAYETIKEFEAFKHRFYDYIGKRAIT